MLKQTIIRILNENKEGILEDISVDPKRKFAIKLHEDPGEILITLLMIEQDIKNSVIEAVKEVFPDKKAYEINSYQKEIIYFKMK